MLGSGVDSAPDSFPFRDNARPLYAFSRQILVTGQARSFPTPKSVKPRSISLPFDCYQSGGKKHQPTMASNPEAMRKQQGTNLSERAQWSAKNGQTCKRSTAIIKTRFRVSPRKWEKLSRRSRSTSKYHKLWTGDRNSLRGVAANVSIPDWLRRRCSLCPKTANAFV